MITVGRVCVKIAGRDSGKRCVVLDVVDKQYVLIAGETRRRKCNIAHLEPLEQTVEIKAGATDAAVEKVLKQAGITYRSPKAKTPAARPARKRATKAKPAQ